MLRKYVIAVWMVCVAVVADAQISEGMKAVIKSLEGLSTEVYMDGEHLAVGYGHHIRRELPLS